MAKLKLIVLFFWASACTGAIAQIDCSTSSKLVCLIPFTTNLYSGASQPSAQAIASTVAFNGPIGAQLSQLPLAASAPGTVILYDNGIPIVYDNLGPILIDRPDVLRQGRLLLGFSFQQFRFNSLDGINLGSVPFVYSTIPTLNPGAVQYIAQTEHIVLKYSEYVALATYGLPEKTDVSVIIPFARVSIGAGTTTAESYFVNSSNVLVPPPITLPNTYTPGFASGIGDISFNVKHLLWDGGESGRVALAVGGILRIPSGDALNYLGSGAYGFNGYGLASYKAKGRISPHAKLAYQWNGPSVLLNPNGITDNTLPGGFQYAAGADAKIIRSLTFSIDFLGNEFTNSPSFSVPPPFTIPVSSATPVGPTQALTTVAVGTRSYTIANLSTGLKWKPFKKQNLILYGNLLTQLNNVGLRSDPVPSGGISYSFDTEKK